MVAVTSTFPLYENVNIRTKRRVLLYTSTKFSLNKERLVLNVILKFLPRIQNFTEFEQSGCSFTCWHPESIHFWFQDPARFPYTVVDYVRKKARGMGRLRMVSPAPGYLKDCPKKETMFCWVRKYKKKGKGWYSVCVHCISFVVSLSLTDWDSYIFYPLSPKYEAIIWGDTWFTQNSQLTVTLGGKHYVKSGLHNKAIYNVLKTRVMAYI